MTETYKLLTVNEAMQAPRLWTLYSKIASDLGILEDDKEEFIAKLVSIAVDTCSWCHEYPKGCQCWNDE